MKANTKSLHARLHNLVYTNKLPNNLCPYFWKLVLAFILFIPAFIIQLPILISDLFTKYKNDTEDRYNMGFVFWLITIILTSISIPTIHLFKMMFNCYSYSWDIAILGIIVWSMIGLVTIVTLLALCLKNRIIKNRYKEKQPSIIGEFIKAKKNKYCPKIDWE